jgi:glycosyltransferase involved in cell wall biosynthesis
MSIGLALIAKDEESDLPNLLASIGGAFDQVVLLDTGSTDRTIALFREWAERQNLPLGFTAETFKWTDDFAAARNAAETLLETDWECWADCDDVIHGAMNLRGLTERVGPGVKLMSALYLYAPGDIQTWPRLFRRGSARWVGRVGERKAGHVLGAWSLGEPGEEFPDFDPSLLPIPPAVAYWEHRKPAEDIHAQTRDLEIARRWVRDQPDNLAARWTLVFEELCRGGGLPAGIPHVFEYVDLWTKRHGYTPPNLDGTLQIIAAAQGDASPTETEIFLLDECIFAVWDLCRPPIGDDPECASALKPQL